MPLHGADICEYDVPEKEASKYDKKSAKGGLRIGYCWAVRTRMREFVISCETVDERDAWIKACQIKSDLPLTEEETEAGI